MASSGSAKSLDQDHPSLQPLSVSLSWMAKIEPEPELIAQEIAMAEGLQSQRLR